jgi:hypothetical protein
LEDALKAGDRAVGVPVLTDLYGKMGNRPMTVDLDGLWKQLGIEAEGRTVRFNDDAPLAAIRRAITDPDSGKPTQPASNALPSAVFAGRTAGSPKRSSHL